MPIEYAINKAISSDAFIELLKQSTLAERRPVEDVECINGMLEHSNLLITAWHHNLLVGVSRSVTDFHYACYLSDLAVHTDYQKQGIGQQLQQLTQQQLQPRCQLILLAAPAANAYYKHIGFTHNPRCWVLAPDQRILQNN